jgi:hypothetical protein
MAGWMVNTGSTTMHLGWLFWAGWIDCYPRVGSDRGARLEGLARHECLDDQAWSDVLCRVACVVMRCGG